jgi:putative transposase
MGIRCGRKRVARLMRKAGLHGGLRGRIKRTSHRDGSAVLAPDLVPPEFGAVAPDKLWVADITYVRADEGFLYLVFVLEAYSRRLVGRDMESHLRTELVVDTLQMAIWRRRPSPGLIYRSDQGVRYTSLSFGKKLEETYIIPSMGRVGSAHDNALAESCVATLKTELLYTATVGPPERPSRQRSSSIWRASTTGEAFIPRSAIGARQSSRRIKCERVAQRKEMWFGLPSQLHDSASPT